MSLENRCCCMGFPFCCERVWYASKEYTGLGKLYEHY